MHNDLTAKLTQALQAFQRQLGTPYPDAVLQPLDEELDYRLTNFFRPGPYRKICKLYGSSGDYMYDNDLTQDAEFAMIADCDATFKQSLVIARALFGESKSGYPQDHSCLYDPDEADFPGKDGLAFDGIEWSIEYEGGAVNAESSATHYWETDSEYIFLQRGQWAGDGNFVLFVLLTATPKQNNTTRGGVHRVEGPPDATGKPQGILALQKAIGAELKQVDPSEVMDWFKRNSYSLNDKNQVNGLNIRDNALTDAKMLVGFAALEKLCLSDNALTAVSDITHLSHMRELDLSSNLLNSVADLDQMVQLTALNINDNTISSLEGIQALTGLTQLYAHANGITDLKPLGLLHNLIEIGLGSNGITDISLLRGFSRLKVLKIAENKVADLSVVAHLRALNYLEADKNPATAKLKPRLNAFENHLEAVRAARANK